MIIHKQTWPMDELFWTKPRHLQWRFEDWTVAMKYVDIVYPDKIKKYEYHLYNERWKNSQKEWQRMCAKKIDCVIEISNKESDIIESDPEIADVTIGQLLSYKECYEKQSGKKVRKMIALTRRGQEQTEKVMRKYGISMVIWHGDEIFEEL